MSDRGKSREAQGSGNPKRRRSRSHSRSRHDRKRRRSRSLSQDSYRRKHHRKHRGRRSLRNDRDQKIDEIFDWVKASSSRRRRSRDRSGSKAYSKRDRSYHSRDSLSKSRSPSSYQRRSHEISFDSSSMRSVVVPVNKTTDNLQKETLPNEERTQSDPLTDRLNVLRAEGVPRPVTGPGVSEDLCPVLGLFLAKSDFAKTMSICEKYPRPDNISQLTIPELPKDANKILDQKAVQNDGKYKNDQKCTVALFGLLSRSLDSVLKLKEKVPELVAVGDMLVDGLQISGFLHQDFTRIRLKGMKQTVNPSYGDVVAQDPEEPEMLLGKTPLGEQMKSCDELNKLKARFKKPEPQTSSANRRDFQKRGEYKRKPFNRDFKPRNRKREDRRTRYLSPKGAYRKNQQDSHKQEEKKNTNFRKA